VYVRHETELRLMSTHDERHTLEEVRVLLKANLGGRRRKIRIHPETKEEDQKLKDERDYGVVEEACADRNAVIRSDLRIYAV
jgi:hypothetical protein